MIGKLGIVTDKEELKTFLKYEPYEEGEKEEIFKRNFSEWRYKLRLGKEVYISTDDVPKKLRHGEFIVIKPGDFTLLLTKEGLKTPENVMGFISMRFDYKQKGLINVSGFHVDPLYTGKLIFSAFNAGPKDIVLREGDPVFMIFFQRIDKECKKEQHGYDNIPADMVEQIRGRSATLAANANRLDKMEFYLKLMGGIVIALIMTVVGVFIRSVLMGK